MGLDGVKRRRSRANAEKPVWANWQITAPLNGSGFLRRVRTILVILQLHYDPRGVVFVLLKHFGAFSPTFWYWREVGHATHLLQSHPSTKKTTTPFPSGGSRQLSSINRRN